MTASRGLEWSEAGGRENQPRPVLAWFRRDLRTRDNSALAWAARQSAPVIPVFVLDPGGADGPLGGASRWWLHGSLQALRNSLENIGSGLVLRSGSAREAIARLARETDAGAICWNRLCGPREPELDKAIKQQCAEAAMKVRAFNSSLLIEPDAVRSGSGSPYQVFTPFWRRCLGLEHDSPDPPPRTLPAPLSWPGSDRLDGWNLRPRNPDWARGLRRNWQPGEAGALETLDRFLSRGVANYLENRDLPARRGTSMLSPHLHFGEIGPRQIFAALEGIEGRAGADAFRRQLGWREFSHHLAFHKPDIGAVNMRRQFDGMAWREDLQGLRRWQQGCTGYPLVDAGMRQLWATGWMHNRARMVASSFLCRHLLIDWRLGAEWFLDTLVDADHANNSMGWQWVAGTGADAVPYFRIFNPVAQSRRFDPRGEYLRAWLPELRKLPDRLIHAPWTASRAELARAGVRFGRDYPLPIVDHKEARRRALHAYRSQVAARRD